LKEWLTGTKGYIGFIQDLSNKPVLFRRPEACYIVEIPENSDKITG
jgi:hypothetical protein